MTPGSSILIVDDDADLARLLVQLMQREGWAAQAVATGEAAHLRMRNEIPDVVILDLMLPDANGLDLCRQWRCTYPTLAILMLTARGDPMDRIIGLELGADDYLPKPFEMRELVARVRVMLRRQATVAPRSDSQLHAGGLHLDLIRREATAHGCSFELSGLEFRLLVELVRAQGQVLSRDRLSALVQAAGYQPLDRTVDVQIARLRRRLEEAVPGNKWIRTVRGEGYAFVPSPPAPSSDGRP